MLNKEDKNMQRIIGILIQTEQVMNEAREQIINRVKGRIKKRSSLTLDTENACMINKICNNSICCNGKYIITILNNI